MGGTTSAFAEEQKTEQSSILEKNVAAQGQEIQGYLFKDGVKTPVYKNAGTYYNSQKSDSAFPQLGSNPHDPIPKEGAVHSENGSIGSTLYFSSLAIPNGVFNGVPIRALTENVYLEKKNDGSIEVGRYDLKTLVRTPMTGSYDQETLKGFFEGTTVKRDTSYQLKINKVLPRTASYKYAEGIKYGMTKEDALSATLTLGVKLGMKASAGVPGAVAAEVATEVSTQLATSYNHKISVTDEKTSSEEISFPGVNNNTYNYDEYAVALYQLQSTYTVKPGKKLQAYLDENKNTFLPMNHGKKVSAAALAQTAFSYADSTTYLAVTPGAAKK
ncbi:hypothetical protein [Bacillus toyonensis]|uniref:hypothetical protein n=1 Tax=Bacillus toyonensis TaxID=155322 RepID=UPI003D652793